MMRADTKAKHSQNFRFGSFSGSHAPAWEPILDAPASRLCEPRRWHVENAFPRRRVGTRKIYNDEGLRVGTRYYNKFRISRNATDSIDKSGCSACDISDSTFKQRVIQTVLSAIQASIWLSGVEVFE